MRALLSWSRVAAAVNPTFQLEGMTTIAQAEQRASALGRLRDREILLAFVLGVAMVVFWRGFASHAYPRLSAAFLTPRSGVGAAEILALIVLALLAIRIRDESVLTVRDLTVVAVSSLAFALISGGAGALPPVIVGAKFVFHRDKRVASMGQILLALAFYEWFGPTLFHAVSPIALKAEALAVQGVLAPLGAFTRDGLTITATSGHNISIEEGCSAFHNISLATLICISLVKLETLTFKWAHVWVCAAMVAATIALNTARIALMAQSPAAYEFWHNGAGEPIVALAILAAMLAICLGGLRIAASR